MPNDGTQDFGAIDWRARAEAVMPSITISVDVLLCLATHGTAVVDGIELMLTSGVPDEAILAALLHAGPMMPETPSARALRTIEKLMGTATPARLWSELRDTLMEHGR